MFEPQQLSLRLATKEQLSLTWAFVDKRRSVVMSCSRQAKQFGVDVGMRYEDAKMLLPDMRTIMLGSRGARTN